MRFRPIFMLVSSFLILVSVFSVWKWGFRPSIDFSGGSLWELSTTATDEQLRQIFINRNIDIISQNNRLFKFRNITQTEKQQLNSDLLAVDPNYNELRFETLGPSLGKELMKKTIYAVLLSSVLLLLFIGFKFKDFSFGISAVLATFHDTFILIGSFSLLGHFWGAELDALFVTALLTTLSASTHDTIVTFDRIRELKRKHFNSDWLSLANQAVSEVIVRSINNSMTIIFMLLSLVLLGGDSTRWFAVALLIGVISGTYSSIGVAIPLVLFWKSRKKN